MPDVITEAGDDTGGKPFDANARDAGRTPAASGSQPVVPGVPQPQPGQPSPSVMSAFGLDAPPGAQPPATPPSQKPNPMFKGNGIEPPVSPVTTPTPVAPTNVDANGQKIVENYSAVIQKHAEQAYATALFNAKQDPSILDAMIATGDDIEKQIAEKLLQRNPELFGAGTLEEYQAKKTLDDAGSDPRDREIAQLKLNDAKREKKEADREWREWKKDNSVKDDSFGELCDQVRKEYPNSPKGDVVAIARGRAGIKPLEPSNLDAAQIPAGGGRGSPADKGHQSEPGALSALQLGSGEVQAAEAYFESIGR